eukprot:764421-Hanusia_phi.AAC.2
MLARSHAPRLRSLACRQSATAGRQQIRERRMQCSRTISTCSGRLSLPLKAKSSPHSLCSYPHLIGKAHSHKLQSGGPSLDPVALAFSSLPQLAERLARRTARVDLESIHSDAAVSERPVAGAGEHGLPLKEATRSCLKDEDEKKQKRPEVKPTCGLLT